MNEQQPRWHDPENDQLQRSVPMDFWNLAPESEDKPAQPQRSEQQECSCGNLGPEQGIPSPLCKVHGKAWRSEQQQKWTPEYVKILLWDEKVSINACKPVADAHNAAIAAVQRALAAEREKFNEACEFNERLSKVNNALRTELAVKQENWEAVALANKRDAENYRDALIAAKEEKRELLDALHTANDRITRLSEEAHRIKAEDTPA